MVKERVFEPVSDPCDWCHPIVLTDKKNTAEKRLTMDLIKLNSQVQRPTHPMRTPRNAIENLENARFLTTLDARHGYWQGPMAPESRHLTTCITPWGRYRFLQNPQGFIVAEDKFNQQTDQAFEGISNFAKVVDDCLVHDATFNDHVKRVRSVLQCARENGITFSKKKFAFAQSEVQFCGYFVSEGGWRMEPERTSALGQFPTLTKHTLISAHFWAWLFNSVISAMKSPN